MMMREVSITTSLRSAPLDGQASKDHELDSFTHVEERIALVKPASSYDDEIMRTMQLLDSMLWAFKKTTRPKWAATARPGDVAEVADPADVIVVHQDDAEEDPAAPKADGKVVVEIITKGDSNLTGSFTLVVDPQAPTIIQLKRKDAPAPVPAEQRSNPGSPYEPAANPWSFVELLRTLKSGGQGTNPAWLVAREGEAPILWLRGDASSFFATSSIAQAIRQGSLDLSSLQFQEGPPPPEGSTLRSGAELSWFAGYYASHEFAPWLNPAARYRALGRPNFAHIRPLPLQLRAAHAFAWAPADAGQLASRASITVGEAVRILNAMATCDMLVVEESGEAVAAEAAETGARLTALVRHLRKHLGSGLGTLTGEMG